MELLELLVIGQKERYKRQLLNVITANPIVRIPKLIRSHLGLLQTSVM